MRALADRGAPPLSDSKRPLITLTGIAARQFSPDAVIKRGHALFGRMQECHAIPPLLRREVRTFLSVWFCGLAPRNRVSSDNLSRTTRASGILGRVKRIEYGFFPAEIPAIESAVKKYHPMPAATSLPHFEFQANHCSNRFYVSSGPISRCRVRVINAFGQKLIFSNLADRARFS